MDLTEDVGQMDDTAYDSNATDVDKDAGQEATQRELQLVAEICQRIKEDKRHHEKAFKRMRRDMKIAMWGSDSGWNENNYRANIIGRHVKMKTAALYAKNPKATAKRRPRLDFAIWDENPASLRLAFQTVQQATLVMQQTAAINEMMPPTIDETGAVVPPPPPQLPPGTEEANALLEDFQQGLQRQQMVAKFGKSLEIVYEYQLREQKPLDFKRGMKSTVRRAVTTAVGYVELGFQRETGPRPGLTEELADSRARLDHLRSLAEQAAEGEIGEFDAEMAELEASLKSLTEEPEIVVREGLVVDYPGSTRVIPDKLTRQLDGFVGARWLTIEYVYTLDQVREIFGVDLDGAYKSYAMNPGSLKEHRADDVMDDDYEWSEPSKKKSGLVCVWKHYDKVSGLVYFIADGHPKFLREPKAPDVFVEGFWPVYALSFNEVESEDELFPPSDVSLLLDMQKEWNRSRQGKREHRQAARPRWVFANGIFADDDMMALKTLKPFESLGLNIDTQMKIADALQAVPVPGVDPNLYDTNEIMADMQLVGGAQEAQYGGVSKSTATESAIAANATNSADSSAIDDLDSFLTTLARDAGQILMREMSEEQVVKIVGPGAVWPLLTDQEIAEEIDLEVEAGSTGKPNKAIEVENWSRLLPMVMQIPGLEPTWLLKETLRRMDDRMDLADAIAAGVPSIAAQNMQSRQALPPPGAATGATPDSPDQQGPQGASNAPKPEQQGGSRAAFGSNQV